MSVYKSRPSPAPPKDGGHHGDHHGGAGEGCVVLRVRLAALHRAVRE